MTVFTIWTPPLLCLEHKNLILKYFGLENLFFFGFIYILRTTGRNQLLPRTEFILFFKKIESRAAIQKWRSRHLDCGTFETLIAALDCDTKLELRQCRSVALRGTGAAMPISAHIKP